ncbi:Aste57867_14018 [Aphanomyces stellatus]|uniref:Aste57867_14018 protein n=1 Tax=Aphanomyces stellatus TaxID=120398 RepID=A0A485KZK8_9STRA|nr:hypothetical protein As57867_013967 [Aphanomyces stellatus]VFT90848.1 Aste57867_14018 [Aphanomyces stellatus]
MGRILLSRVAVAALLTLYDAAAQLTSFPLCRGNPAASYSDAGNTYPQVKKALSQVSQYQIATWWTDNNAYHYTEMQKLLNNCNDTSVPTVVIYGLPNKDCGAAFSNLGTNRDADTYVKFVQDLADLVGTRPVNYILEPDAIGLTLNAPCALTSGYLDNMMSVVPLLTGDNNPNASLYLDVGYWALQNESTTSVVVQAVKQLASKGGAIRGIALDTSNYRTTTEMVGLCTTFSAAAYKSMRKNFTCVVDTSRNYIGPKDGSREWCNSKFAAIGVPPTSATQSDLLDYFLWIKTPGESDGPCNTPDITGDALKNGPPAGQFFEKAFSMMWDQGYFVDKKLGDKLNEYAIDGASTSGMSVSWIVIVIVVAVLVFLVVGGIVMKRRHDAKEARSRNTRQVRLLQESAAL